MKKEEFIEKYIQNRLSSEEKSKFDELMIENAEFNKEVKWHENIKMVAQHEDTANFKTLIVEIESQNVQKNKKTYAKWIAAVGIILLLGLSYFLITDNKIDSNELFTYYFEPYRNVIQPIERGAVQQDEKKLAFAAYEKGEYKKAIKLFTKLYADSKESYYLFYNANALLKIEKTEEAIPLLLAHLKTKDTLTEKTNWYLALAYLKLKDKDKAKAILKKVIVNNSYKTKEANELLEKLK